MEIFSQHTGSWRGTNGFRLMPTDPLAPGPATAEVSLGAGGHLAQVSYTWTHPDDGEQSGLLVLGPGEEAGSVVALWGDSWHQAQAAARPTGSVEGGVVDLALTYGGDWGWTISVDTTDPAALRLRMENVVPESAVASGGQAGAYLVMETDLRRA